jgi:hypothetical protein
MLDPLSYFRRNVVVSLSRSFPVTRLPFLSSATAVPPFLTTPHVVKTGRR